MSKDTNIRANTIDEQEEDYLPDDGIFMDGVTYGERADDLARQNANAFTRTSGVLDTYQLDEWLRSASIQSQVDFGAFMIGTGVDEYNQSYLVASQPDGPHLATIPPKYSTSRTLSDDELKQFVARVSVEGTSGFGAFDVLFGFDEHFADFLLIQNSEGGPHFLLVVSDDEGGAR